MSARFIAVVVMLATGSPADRDAVRAILDDQVAAWNRGDLDGFMRGYWKSPALSFYSGGTKTAGWQATLERYQKRYQAEGKEMGKLAFSELDIEMLGGDHAVVKGRWQLTLKREMPGGLFTLIVRKLPEGWRIVHDHTSSEPAPVREKLRVLIETDLGGDADDQASLVRFLLYASEWDVEGIIADREAATFHKDPVRDHLGLAAKDGYELAQAYLKAYGQVHPNLVKHQPDYPSYESLRRVTVPGFNSTDAGVRLIIAAADRLDPRPIWYSNWGSNSGAVSNLKRALDKVQAERSPADYAKFAGRFRIVTLDGPGSATRQGHEDKIALHIETGYPTMDGGRWYHRLRPLTEKAGGFDVQRDIKKNHGPLGALYTTPKEGDSWTFIYLIPNGLSDPRQPAWGGWAGRYAPRGPDPSNKGPKAAQYFWANQRDTLDGTTNRDNTVLRWVAHLQNDFKTRLDWCVAAKFEDANHEPAPHCQGDASRRVLHAQAPAGKPYRLSAAGSTDPDGDRLRYRWYVYPEAGDYSGAISIQGADQADALLDVPADAVGKSIHVILEVTDAGTPPLTRYRRVVIAVDR